MPGDEHDVQLRFLGHESQHLEAVHIRHAQVEEDEIGPHGLDAFQRLRAVLRLAHDFDRRARQRVDHGAQPQPGDLLVVHH